MKPAAPRVLLHVQHLLGTGHTRRMAAIARALSAAGAEVLMASGGTALPGLDAGGARVLQLPVLRAADASYNTLLDEHGTPVDEHWRERRAELLVAEAMAFAPHMVLIETFPFGRRMLRFELLPLLARLRALQPRPRVYCSVRDILEPPRKPGRAEETVARVFADFDGVLVHGEPDLTPLAMSFALAGQLAERVRYTGYVVDAGAVAAATPPARDEVLVSAGGGAVGLALLECALPASALSRTCPRGWRLLVAPGIAEQDFRRLRDDAGREVNVERNRTDFRALLAGCRVSVSQAGYNTLAEALVAGARVVAVPFAEAGEREQGLRAHAFASAGLIHAVTPQALTPAALAAAVDVAAGAPPPSRRIASDGAAVSARMLLGERR